jgi:outer membrane protein OmpA-like peptidoglycan-associated protein
MKLLLRLGVLAIAAAVPLPVLAQTPAASTDQSTDQSTPSETRPATNTFLGDTGLWFVPTGEVLPARRWSGGGYYINQDFTEAFMDIGNFVATFGYGLGDRAEVFGGFQLYRRVDTDRRPLLSIGAPIENPNPTEGWQEGVGDLYVGAKVNLSSQWRQQPVAFAVRGILKLPTASFDDGLGTGKVDFLIDGIVSKELPANVELSGFAGVALRGSPDEVESSHGLRYGVGVAVPTRSSLRFVGELFGEKYFDNSIEASVLVPAGADPLFVGARPSVYGVKSPAEFFIGLDYLHTSGFFAGAGLRGNVNFDGRGNFIGADDEGGDNMGVQVRLGYHPGVRIYVPPAPPPPPPPVVQNRPPTVKARCEPCVVQVGKSATVTADAQDPDGDTLTYKWSVPTGKLANPADRQTLWTAPEQEGSVPVTITVDDGKGGTATDTVTIQVVRPPVREYKFEDVHFDFDRYSLRAEATRVLDEVVRAMTDNPELRIEVEGHTCNIGTAEYNLALGERRATSVRDYLTSRGIGTDRLRTVSYGEERPKHDNAREETRRLNRRAGLVVRLTQ